MTTMLLYAGVRWPMAVWRESGGPGLAPWWESELQGDPILVDPDAWHDETTAYPFTLDEVRRWYYEEGCEVIHELAVAQALVDCP